MTDDRPSTPDAELRALARQLLERGDVTLPTLPEADVSRLVQELQVAYAELQVQYRQIQETQRRLAASEARYRVLFEEAPTGVLVVDRRGQVVRVNRTLAGWLQRRPADLIGRPFVAVLVGGSQSAFAAFVQSRVRPTATNVEEIEIQCRAADGTQFPASLRGAEIPGESEDEDTTQVLLTCTDLRHRRQLEERLARAQKLEALGILASGIAHDFNNTLQIMRGYAEFLTADDVDDENRRTMAGHVLEAAERARQITAQVQLFARRRMIQPEIVDVGQSVSDTLRLLRPLLGDDIVVEFDGVPGRLPVRLDGGQLGQIVMNLAANARDAMQSGGTLRVSAGRIEFDELRAEREPGLVAGQTYVELRFADDGSGIEPEHISRIFDPFFTTKPVGRGSGLGLATVYGIVQRAGGTVEVHSERGNGTEFVIRLPAHEEPVGTEAPAAVRQAERSAASGAATPTRRLQILLVDDSTPVRDVAASMLGSAGHVVHVAAGPDEALQMVDGLADPLDLLVSDVVMPRMNGFELAERIRDRIPGLPTLFVSGHTRDEIAARGNGDPAPRVLAKPFSRDALLRAVEDAFATGVR